MDNLFGDLSFTNDSAVKKATMSLAFKAIAEESEKFEEALLAVMSQRVQEYLQVKLGSVDDAKLKKIVKMSQFKDILQENLVEFNIFYTKQVEKRASKFTDDAITEYYNKLSLEGFTVKNMNKSDQQLAYEIVE